MKEKNKHRKIKIQNALFILPKLNDNAVQSKSNNNSISNHIIIIKNTKKR